MQTQLRSSLETKTPKSWSRTNHLTIEPAQWKDMEKVCRFIRSTSKWYEKFVDEKDMAEHEVDMAWAKKNFDLRDFYLGYHLGEAVGTISIQYFEQYAYLGYIYLDKKHVGKGFGHQLMSFAENKTKENGAKGMALIAHPKAGWACRAYRKFGFKLLTESKDDILTWENGALKPHYEEGFNLFVYQFQQNNFKYNN